MPTCARFSPQFGYRLIIALTGPNQFQQFDCTQWRPNCQKKQKKVDDSDALNDSVTMSLEVARMRLIGSRRCRAYPLTKATAGPGAD